MRVLPSGEQNPPERRTPKPERKFKCSTCGKYFHQSSHLVAHQIIHSGDRPFKCPECGKSFGRASHLKTHRRLHTGEKPFKCTYCDKSFTQKAGLLAHVRLHTGERPFKCEQCGQGFRLLSLLLSHKAQEASGRARPASGPSRHQPQRTESCSEDLKCGVCCRTFVRSSYIRLHIRLNRGQRPYHSKVCNKTSLLEPQETGSSLLKEVAVDSHVGDTKSPANVFRVNGRRGTGHFRVRRSTLQHNEETV
ncbi:zinc finger protein 239-like [Cololabis saira]|uniref:zinc finger protein 239-like n=1 Tax=Cololabis saira TaxID=129043 RepID=UPI002AD4F5D8|nr:zinc finger protein 239-like [Cololabis saira]